MRFTAGDNSFTAAAEKAGNSRIVADIHFSMDNIQRLITGAKIADQLMANDFALVPEASCMAVRVSGVMVFLTLRRRNT